MPEMRFQESIFGVSVPVGTVLAYIGDSEHLPAQFALCNGRVITDADSPFHGQKTPDLTNDMFLRGVATATQVQTVAGRNDIPLDGQHNHHGQTDNAGAHRHTGTTDLATDRGPGVPGAYESEGDEKHFHNHGFTSDGVPDHSHSYNTSQQAAHSHGGENRPLSFGVWFIMRIK